MQTTLSKQLLLALSTAALLTACGGGNSAATAPAEPGAGLVKGSDLPMAVEQSTKGVIDFAKAQIAATSETSDPLLLGDAKLATDDSSEPSDV